MNKFNIIGIGELLWDMLPNGKELGGAPTNFCFHINNLGGNATVISAVGDDQLGDEAVAILIEKNIKYHIQTTKYYPTGTVTVTLIDGIPYYIIHENVAWDQIQVDQGLLSQLSGIHAICYGSLAQRSEISRGSVQKILKSANKQTLKVFDINLRQHYYNKKIICNSLFAANVLKLNDEELEVLKKMLELPEIDEIACTVLLNRFDLKVLALTKGEKGSFLLTKDEISTHVTPKVDVVDTIGAGDSFTAAMVMGLLNKKPLKQIHKEAAEYAAKICTIRGATAL